MALEIPHSRVADDKQTQNLDRLKPWADSTDDAVAGLEAAPPPHAASHLPGGSDALTTGTPVAVGTANAAGAAASFARSDHVHAPPPLESRIAVLGGVGFANSWGNYGAGYSPAAYYKDPHGIVHLEGLIAGGTVALEAFTLPAGYRPPATCLFPSFCASGAARVDVNTSGDVTVISAGSNAFVALDGITFRV